MPLEKNPMKPSIQRIFRYAIFSTLVMACTLCPAFDQPAANGIKVGDSVEVVTGFGWTPAKVLAINGNTYRVSVQGIQVSKDYPAEVRRVGGASAQDHANGQYRLGDPVQVHFQGQWIDSKIVTEYGMQYQVELPGNRTVWADPQNLRPAPARAAAPL